MNEDLPEPWTWEWVMEWGCVAVACVFIIGVGGGVVGALWALWSMR